MKKTIFITFLFILFILSISVFYLSFFGYETTRFNDIIKSEIKKNNKDIVLDFKKISLLLDAKKLTLFVKFINPNINYKNTTMEFDTKYNDSMTKQIREKIIDIQHENIEDPFGWVIPLR